MLIKSWIQDTICESRYDLYTRKDENHLDINVQTNRVDKPCNINHNKRSTFWLNGKLKVME